VIAPSSPAWFSGFCFPLSARRLCFSSHLLFSSKRLFSLPGASEVFKALPACPPRSVPQCPLAVDCNLFPNAFLYPRSPPPHEIDYCPSSSSQVFPLPLSPQGIRRSRALSGPIHPFSPPCCGHWPSKYFCFSKGIFRLLCLLLRRTCPSFFLSFQQPVAVNTARINPVGFLRIPSVQLRFSSPPF